MNLSSSMHGTLCHMGVDWELETGVTVTSDPFGLIPYPRPPRDPGCWGRGMRDECPKRWGISSSHSSRQKELGRYRAGSVDRLRHCPAGSGTVGIISELGKGTHHFIFPPRGDSDSLKTTSPMTSQENDPKPFYWWKTSDMGGPGPIRSCWQHYHVVAGAIRGGGAKAGSAIMTAYCTPGDRHGDARHGWRATGQRTQALQPSSKSSHQGYSGRTVCSCSTSMPDGVCRNLTPLSVDGRRRRLGNPPAQQEAYRDTTQAPGDPAPSLSSGTCGMRLDTRVAADGREWRLLCIPSGCHRQVCSRILWERQVKQRIDSRERRPHAPVQMRPVVLPVALTSLITWPSTKSPSSPARRTDFAPSTTTGPRPRSAKDASVLKKMRIHDEANHPVIAGHDVGSHRSADILRCADSSAARS